MKYSFYLAWRYLLHHKMKYFIVVFCITLIAYLPIALKMIGEATQHNLLHRAKPIALLVGAKGSATDLVLSTLYYSSPIRQSVSMRLVNYIDNSKLGFAIPIVLQDHVRSFPMIATTIDYFELRKLELKKGAYFAVIGDCVVGAQIAKKLHLQVGSTLSTTPSQMFDISSLYPITLHVSGILKPSKSPDDSAIFTDLKTAWVLHGLGHGHEDLRKAADNSIITQQQDNNIVANRKLTTHNKLTLSNMASFHFHGDAEDYPVSAIIIVPNNKKDQLLLLGRLRYDIKTVQSVNPRIIIKHLMNHVFKVENLFHVLIATVLLSSILALLLIFMLAHRLRRHELVTMYKMGCARLKIAEIVAAEISIMLLSSVLALSLLLLMTRVWAQDVIFYFLN